MATLEGYIGDLQIDRDDTFKKLNELKALIAEAKASQGREDPELLAKIRDIEAEAKVFEKELIDVDAKIADLKKKRGDAKKLLNEVLANPEKFSPQ
jgi:chromosome segregation ATPase